MKHFICNIVVTSTDDPDFQFDHAIKQIKEGFTSGMTDHIDSNGTWGRTRFSLTEEKALTKGESLYLVRLKQRQAEWETKLVTTVQATSSDEAEKLAIAGFVGCEIGAGAYEEDGGIYDRYGEVHYSVQMVNRLDPEEALIFKRFNI